MICYGSSNAESCQELATASGACVRACIKEAGCEYRDRCIQELADLRACTSKASAYLRPRNF